MLALVLFRHALISAHRPNQTKPERTNERIMYIFLTLVRVFLCCDLFVYVYVICLAKLYIFRCTTFLWLFLARPFFPFLVLSLACMCVYYAGYFFSLPAEGFYSSSHIYGNMFSTRCRVAAFPFSFRRSLC